MSFPRHFHLSTSPRESAMNGTSTHIHSTSNEHSTLKSLPLKKRRTYLIDALVSNDEQNENAPKTNNQSCSPHDGHSHSPSPARVPTPPSSPHIEFLRQQYAYLLANSTNVQLQNYQQPALYSCFSTSHVPDHNHVFAQQPKCTYTTAEDATIDEHFRKSLGDNYEKFTDRCFTPDDSSSNSSSVEQTSVDSIEEHFARSLAKFRSAGSDQVASINRQITESVVDDHFAKALGSATWQKLKEKL